MGKTLEEKRIAACNYSRKYRKLHPLSEEDKIAKRDKNSKWREANPESERKYRENHLGEKRKRSHKYYELHNDRGRKRRYERNFGITIEQYEQLLSDQNEVCAICGNVPSKRQLSVDGPQPRYWSSSGIVMPPL